jgi:hypothetical protein
MPRNKIKQDFHFTTLKRLKIICELKRALYGIKCVLSIFFVPYEISKVNFHVETKILVSMSEEIK